MIQVSQASTLALFRSVTLNGSGLSHRKTLSFSDGGKSLQGLHVSVALINRTCGTIHPEAFTSERLSLFLDRSVGWFLLKQIKGRQVNANRASIKARVPATVPMDWSWEGCRRTPSWLWDTSCLLGIALFCYLLFIIVSFWFVLNIKTKKISGRVKTETATTFQALRFDFLW